MERRIGVNGLLRKDWLFSFPLLLCLTGFAPGTAFARSPIINDNPNFGNKSAVFFQRGEAPIRLRSLEESDSAEKQVNIVVPSSPAISLNRRDISITFPASSYEADPGIVSKGLLYSDDRGENWHEYGGIRPASEGDQFPFSAPRDGEYWFAIHLIHQDGSDTASRAQKFVFDTGTGAGAAPAADAPQQGGDRMVQGLMSLTQKNSASSAGGDPLASQVNTQNQSADPFSSSNSGAAEVPFPGKINWVQQGKTKSGEPGLSLSWFQPSQINGEKSEGKIRIERAPSPDGPWTPVTDDAVDLDINGSGYWFSGKAGDQEPFYLRTVSTVKMDGTETEWIDTLPKPLRFGAVPSKSDAPDPPELSDLEGRREKSSGSISAWNDSGSQSGSDRGSHDSVVNKTSSVNSNESSERPDTEEVVRSARRDPQTFTHPQLTNPQQISVNPIFHFGLGVFTGKDRNGNRLPDYSDAGSAPAYAANTQADNEPSMPAPLPKRPIWMTKQEYEMHVQEYERECEQARFAQRQREEMKRQREEMKMTAQGGVPGGQRATITDSQGNQINITEGSVVYQDEKGNISTTPFPGQTTGGMMQDMTFPDQNFSNVSQPMPVDGQPIPMNSGQSLYQPNAMNSFGDPYTNKEQTLGGNTYDMTSLPNQSLVPSELPPRPDAQR